MAVTATLVNARPTRLRYLLANDGAAGISLTIATSGVGFTNDLLIDSVAGPIKRLAKATTDGYGAFGPGVLTQAQARALWLSNRISTSPGSIDAVVTARCEITPRAGAALDWIIDANVDGSGRPILVIEAATSAGASAAGTAYLDVEIESNMVGV